MKTNELNKNSEERSTYKNQMHFQTLAINNRSKLSIYIVSKRILRIIVDKRNGKRETHNTTKFLR